MRSTFSVSIMTLAVAGCLTLSLGCRQGEGDRCEISADCSGDLECFGDLRTHNGVCRPRLGSGAAGSSGQSTGLTTSTETSTETSTGTGTSTDTGTGSTDASVAPTGGDDAGPSADGSLTD